jgi:hypothetical protein
MSTEGYISQSESDIQKMESDLVKQIEAQAYSKEEIQEAYFRVCGISDETKNSDRVDTLHSEMEKMTQNRFPLNRFKSLVEGLDVSRVGVESFNSFVSNLPVTEKEKLILRSIVEKRRSGILSILSRDKGTTLMACKISTPDNAEMEGFAGLLYIELKQKLNLLPETTPISITFSED